MNFFRNRCSIFDVSHMLQTRVHGRDRVEFMESICTADVAGLANGAAALTVFTNDQGGIVDDLIVTKVRGATTSTSCQTQAAGTKTFL